MRPAQFWFLKFLVIFSYSLILSYSLSYSLIKHCMIGDFFVTLTFKHNGHLFPRSVFFANAEVQHVHKGARVRLVRWQR